MHIEDHAILKSYPSPVQRGFASDNHSGIHPKILEAIVAANQDHALAYGADPWTSRLKTLFAELFQSPVGVYPTFNGTGTNVLAFKAVCESFHAVLCSENAHIHVDECGAPEALAHVKLITIKTPDGKLTPELLEPAYKAVGDPHHVQPKVVSVAQSTELGTVYNPQELRTLAEWAHQKNLLLHVDGARIGNAVATIGQSLKAIFVDTGVDLISFGGTKNGMMMGEALVILNASLDQDLEFYRKQLCQLSSKMRFISAQFHAYFQDDLWLTCAAHSNQMAKLLESQLREVHGLRVTQKVESNGVFVIFPTSWPMPCIEALQKIFPFYIWNESTRECRLMTSFDTAELDIERFMLEVRRISK